MAIVVLWSPVSADELRPFQSGAAYRVCFTPGMDCEGMIVAAIASAKHTIKVQAYSFTSAPIANAIAEASERGVEVLAIVDKSQRTARYTGATFLANAHIPVLVDVKPKIAHNKVVIIDKGDARPIVLTGSFNFTKAAQRSNAENVIEIVGNRNVAAAHAANFMSRKAVSVPYELRQGTRIN
ncbi:phospholipase D family protein [Parvibaculum sedimenti]|nr:phospholipase D family protein [Parvibaculum sedimenti]